MTTLLTGPMLDARRFPQERVDALFQAVLIDDNVDAHTPLPPGVTLDHDEDLLADCYRLCRQLWHEGVDQDELRALLATLRRDYDLGDADRLRFKHIRARLKHYRFALALFRADHRYPPVTDWLTTALGHVQDGYKNGQPARVRRKAAVAGLLLSPVAHALLTRERDRLPLTSGPGFRAYLGRENAFLAAMVARPTVTGAEFHAARKVASRQVAFYDMLHIVRFSDEAYAMSRALAAINGLMGAMHDGLVERRAAGTQDYHHAHFPLPDEIAGRIDALIGCYRASGLVMPPGAARHP